MGPKVGVCDCSDNVVTRGVGVAGIPDEVHHCLIFDERGLNDASGNADLGVISAFHQRQCGVRATLHSD